MGKAQKKVSAWPVLLQGITVTLALYLAGSALLAALLVRGTLPESGAFLCLAVLCLLVTATGGMVAGNRTGWGRLPGGLAIAAAFSGVLLCVGGCWQGVCWNGQTATLLLCALGGGILAGLIGSSLRRKTKRKRRGKVL